MSFQRSIYKFSERRVPDILTFQIFGISAYSFLFTDSLDFSVTENINLSFLYLSTKINITKLRGRYAATAKVSISAPCRANAIASDCRCIVRADTQYSWYHVHGYSGYRAMCMLSEENIKKNIFKESIVNVSQSLPCKPSLF